MITMIITKSLLYLVNIILAFSLHSKMSLTLCKIVSVCVCVCVGSEIDTTKSILKKIDFCRSYFYHEKEKNSF